MSQSLHPMLNIAVKAARAAGAIINRGSQDLDLLKITTKGPNDFVSEVDRAAEAAIIEILLESYPGHAILAEESGREHGAQHSEFCWIIDPLDGTTNFLHGFPVYAVSIALAFRGVVQQAVSTLDFDYVGYAERHLARCLACASDERFGDWLHATASGAMDCPERMG